MAPPKHTTLRHDLTGKRFGRLTVIKRVILDRRGVFYLCSCDCGNEKVIKAPDLSGGKTTSCGCYRDELITTRSTTHGLSKTPTWLSWQKMIRRCVDENDSHHWEKYGGRGITVCDRWRDSFENFLLDMGERPTGKSLDRIDNDKAYSPDNCRWATQSEQMRNTRSNRYITFNGETKILEDWAKSTGISKSLIHIRIFRMGWSVERALTETPAVKKRRKP